MSLAILSENSKKVQIFTIEDMLFGRFDLFDINFLKVSNTTSKYDVPSTNAIIKKNVAGWFYALRNFSIVALLAVLIFIGIMMAISTIASDRAKYKKMLTNWFVSFAIVMILPYIMAIVLNLSEVCVNTVRNVAERIVTEQIATDEIEQTKGLNFEKILLYGRANTDGKGFEGFWTKLHAAYGWTGLALFVVYVILVIYQMKFFFMYLKRLFSVAFLIVISPLITITYSIDKARDNQAQAYKTWLKEFLVNAFIQPLHALVFMIFMYSVYGIMERAPLLAIIFLGALSRGEMMVRKIFKVERTTSMGFLRRRK